MEIHDQGEVVGVQSHVRTCMLMITNQLARRSLMMVKNTERRADRENQNVSHVREEIAAVGEAGPKR